MMPTKEFLQEYYKVLDRKTTKELFKLMYDKFVELQIIRAKLEERYEEGLRT